MDKLKKIMDSKKIKIDIFHIFWLKPFVFKSKYLKSLNKTKIGLVIDSTYEVCSISEHIALKLMQKSKNSKVFNYGMKDKSPGCSPGLLNGTPDAFMIYNKIKKLLKN